MSSSRAESPAIAGTHALALVKPIKLIKMLKPLIASALLAAFLISLISFLNLICSCCRGTHLQRTTRISHGLGKRDGHSCPSFIPSCAMVVVPLSKTLRAYSAVVAYGYEGWKLPA